VEALAEERALLRELNHRVKNNLQMVASLLNIQARAAPDQLEAWGLARAHDRVQLLALAHQRIYESGELRDIRIDDLVAEIARQLLQSRGAASKEVKLVTDLGPARASADHAVPLAFLIGEGISAVLDSLKDARAVELHLMLAQDDDGEIRFAIDAVGGGLTPVDANPRIIGAFARQLGASVGRNAQRPYMLWAVLPRLTSAED
jgi:two-component sensor histidine kinase